MRRLWPTSGVSVNEAGVAAMEAAEKAVVDISARLESAAEGLSAAVEEDFTTKDSKTTKPGQSRRPWVVFALSSWCAWWSWW
jgi:hypothetical protein